MNNDGKLELSIIVPVYNEEDNVVELHRQIVSVCQRLQKSYEIIFVNDGSCDGTYDKLRKLYPITIINFRKNFGQTAAFDAGFKYASGDIFVTLDGDLQNDPEDIPRLLEKMQEGYDVVSGWRKNRRDPFMKRISSRMANILRRLLINDGIHDSGCSLKAYKRECFEHVDLYGEMHRFIPAVLRLKGFKVGEVVVSHHPRTHGQTKYNWKRGIKGILDMGSLWFWRKYANRPLHLFGTFGLFLIVVSTVSGIFVIYQKFFLRSDLSETILSELAMFAFLAGIQFIVFGLIADTILKNYYASSNDRPYIIKEIIKK